jgi:S-formylglutathione hydrolase FrmB
MADRAAGLTPGSWPLAGIRGESVFGQPRERYGAALLVAAVLLTACSSSAGSPTTSAAPDAKAGSPAVIATPGTATCSPLTDGIAYKMSSCQVDAPSLAGNMLGDPATLSTYVLTPIDYETSGIRYPVVYMLAGYTDPATGIAYSLEAAPEPNQGSPVNPIIVVVSGVNAFGGGFYVNSTVSGNWEDAIAKDLVAYVDTSYRSIAKPASRGIAGTSMGGFGAVNIAMHRADVFGSLFALSAGLFDPDGAQARLGDPAVIQEALSIQKQVAGLSPAAAATELKDLIKVSEGIQFEFAYGAAFAPDPEDPALMQFPFRIENGQTVRDDALWTKWEAGFGGLTAKLQQYRANLQKLRGVAVDYGTLDEYAWIPKGDHYFAGLLQNAGIDVVETTFVGGHEDHVGERLVNQMLPFMSAKLSAS